MPRQALSSRTDRGCDLRRDSIAEANTTLNSNSRYRWFSTAKTTKDCCGASKLTVIVFSLLAGALFYAAYQIVPFYYYYFELHNQMIAIIPKAETLKDEEIRARIGKIIKDLGIAAEPKDLIIDRQDRKMRLKLKYTEVFYVPWRDRDFDLHYFDFVIDVEGPY